MKLSNRELALGWMTVVTVVLGVTYWFGGPKAEEWRNARKAMSGLRDRRQMAESLLTRQDSINSRLAALRQQLPEHPKDKDVTAELLKMLERTAREQNLNLLRREPEKEKSVGDLYEVAINCTWEADLGALVRFLYALQVQGAILDIRQLTMTPAEGGGEKLKGNFTVDCAYSRASDGAGPAGPEAGPRP